MKGFFATLQPRLLAIMLLAGMPTGVLLLGYVWQTHNQVMLEKLRYAHTLVEGLASAQEVFILRTQSLLKHLAKVPAVQKPTDPACGKFLGQIASANGDYLNFAVARPNGELVCSARPLKGRVRVADHDFIQLALLNRGFAISSYQVDRVSKQASLGFAYPVIDQRRGRITGVAIAMVSLEAWSRRLGSEAMPVGAVAFMIDGNKSIVAHYPLNKRLFGLVAESYGYDPQRVLEHTGSRVVQSPDPAGVERAYAYMPLHTFDEKPILIIGVSLPLTEAIAVSRERLWQGLVFVSLGLLIMSGVMILGLKHSIIQPLGQLLTYTKSLEHDQVDKLPTVRGVSELQTLMTQIAEMVKTRVATELDLRTSEARFRLIAETIQEVFWVVTPDWEKVLYVNPAYEYIWQRSIDSLYRSPNSWKAAIVQEDRQKVLDYVAELADGDCSNIVFPLYRIERRDGTVRWISAKGFPAYDEDGELTSVVGIAEDVTERKQYEAELSEREAKYRLLVEHAEDLVVKVDTDGHFLFVSQSYCRTFGKSEYQLLGKAFMPLVHEDDKAATSEALKKLYYPPFSVYLEQRAMTAQGWRWIGWSHSAVLDEHQQVIEIIGVGRDITQQKKTELALRESETRNRELVDNMSDGVVVYKRIDDTQDFIISNLNRAAERMAGYTKEQVLGQQVDVIFPGVKELGLLDTIRQVANVGTPVHRPVSTYHDQRLELLIEYYVFKLPSGEVVAVFRDATAEQRADEALRDSEQKFRGFFEDISVGLVIADRHAVTLEANNAFVQMFGFARAQVIGASLQALLAAESHPEIADRLADLVSGRLDRYRFQASYQLAGERTLTANVAIGALYDQGKRRALLYGIAEDVTALEQAQHEHTKLQHELMRTDRLDALGRLAGGIAHDFNNILGAIYRFVELAATRMGSVEPQQIQGYLRKSMENSERAKQLIKQLLIFSRGPECQASKPQDFSKVVRNSLDMLRSLLPSSIAFEVRLAERPFRVVCDPVQIEQVLLNLCINARDAMDGKGSIQVDLDGYHAQGERCAICSDCVEGDWVSLRVQDSAAGISETDLQHIFEPFFSTKEREKGTGLGLSVVQGIVAGYNGHILVDSKPLKGSSFRILFPAYQADVEAQDDAHVAPARLEPALFTMGARVLVVDDEDPIRQLLKEALVSEGHEVELCADGDAAWELLRDRKHGFDLLITDQTMPHLTGIELVRKLRASGDMLPVVFCTGFSELVNEQVLKELDINHYLEKPVRLNQLRAILHALLLAKISHEEEVHSSNPA